MNRDTLTGIIGALILVAAMTGVFLYERGQFQEYTIAWEEGDTKPATATGTLAHGASSPAHPFLVNVTDAVVAGVTIELVWTANPGDTFKVEVTSPAGDVRSQEGRDGRLTFSPWSQPAPTEARFADRTEDGAVAQALGALNETARAAGQGNWSVKVTLVDAMRPMELDPLGVLDPEPGSNSYSLTFSHAAWEPAVRALGP